MSKRVLAACALTLGAWLAAPSSLLACSCAGWRSLPEAAKTSDVVVVLRIERQVRLTDAERWHPEDVDYVDASVLAVLKGQERRTSVRVWDSGAHTSCAGGFGKLVDGTIGVFAAHAKEADQDVLMGLNPPLVHDGDLVVGGGCTTDWEVVADVEEARIKIQRD